MKKVIKRDGITVDYLEPFKHGEEEEKRELGYQLRREINEKKKEIAALVELHIRDIKRIKNQKVKELKRIQTELEFGGQMKKGPATIFIDRSSGKVHYEVDGVKRRFLHRDDWVTQRKMTEDEYESDEFFDQEI